MPLWSGMQGDRCRRRSDGLCRALRFFYIGFVLERILAVDFGRRRIGLAVSDELGLTAQGIPTVQVNGVAEALRAVAETAAHWKVQEIVVGLPLNMDGSSGPMAAAANAFAESLREETGLAVTGWDERLTTVSAKRSMNEMKTKRGKRKGEVDRIAATLLLDSYLQRRSRDSSSGCSTE